MMRKVSEATLLSEPRAVSVVSRIDSAYVVSAASIVLVISVAVFVVHQLNPSLPAPVGAPVTDFSGERALKHLTVIAQRPHPVGSSEHAAVASYIQSEVTALGLTPEVQQTPAATNILVRLKGTADGKAVLLGGHYDTVPKSPGAGDNGSAVAAILETLRALKSGPQLRDDVIAFFSDAEELGTVGARAFVYQHAWANDIGVVLNFDARGTGGPVIMFETSDNNGWLVREFAKAAPHPVANSLAPAIYKLMPNDTDLTVFKDAGFPGLNFAYIGGLNHYHTALDNLTNLDHRTLQHQGETALALTRHFGNLDLTGSAVGNSVFFDLFNSTMVVYSERWVLPLAVLVCVIFVALAVVGFRNKHLTSYGLFLGFMAVPLSVLAAVLILFPLKELLGLAVASDENNLDLVLFIVITIGVLLVVNVKFRRKVGISNLMVGGYLWFLLLLAVTSLFLKGGSYLFTWPLLFNLGALAFVLPRKQRESFSIKLLMLQVVAALAGIILFSPLVYLTAVALTLRSLGGAIAIAGTLVLLLGPLTPHFAVVTGSRNHG